MRPARKKLTFSRADQMRQTSHISLSRVAANGAAPPGAEASAVTSAFRRAPGRGCSRTGPATANAESPPEVARTLPPDDSSYEEITGSAALHPSTTLGITERSRGMQA